MLRTIIRKEIISHVLSLRFAVTFSLFLLLVFASFYVTANQYERESALYSAGVRRAADHLERVMESDDADLRIRRTYQWSGRLDSVPVPPLSSVAPGLQPFTPPSIHTSSEGSGNLGRHYGSNPLASLFQVPDLIYVVSIVLSLLAILFAFDSICGEKESGTLRLMLSNAVPRDTVLLGKWIGGYVVLIIPFLIAAFGGIGYAWWRGVLELRVDHIQRIAALLVVACIYISVFFSLSLFISTVTHKAVTSLFICLLVWTLWILVIPNLSPVIAKILSPAPSIEKINAEKRAVDIEVELRVARLRVESGTLDYGKANMNKKARLREEGRQRKAKWDRLLAEDVKRQTNLAETLGRCSPSVCWTYAGTTLMGTGPDSYRRFRKAQDRLLKEMSDELVRLQKEARTSGKYPLIEPHHVPSLKTARSTAGDDMRSALNDTRILMVLNVAFFMAAFVCFLRYDVR